jgi:hypothetical protein
MSWSPEKNEMVQAIVKAESGCRRRHKQAWSTLPINDQVDDIMRELDRDGFEIVPKRVASAGRAAMRINAMAKTKTEIEPQEIH